MIALPSDGFIRAQASTTIPDFTFSKDGLALKFGSVECLVMSLVWKVCADDMSAGFLINQGELARRFGVSRVAVNTAIKSLMERGYIMLSPDSATSRTATKTYMANREVVNAAMARMAGFAVSDVITIASKSGNDARGEAAATPSPATDRGTVAGAPSQQMPEEADKAYHALLSGYPRRTASSYAAATERAYGRLLSDGYGPDEIAVAAEAYVRENEGKDGHYLMYLRTFLDKDAGARHYIEAARREAARAAEAVSESDAAKPTETSERVAAARFGVGRSGRRSWWMASVPGLAPFELVDYDPNLTEDDLRAILATRLGLDSEGAVA